MICPNCQHSIPEEKTSCPHCGQIIIHSSSIVDPELVTEANNGHRGKSNNFFFFHSASSPFYNPVRTGIITMALALAIGLQYGFLAILGFLFFYASLSILALALRINMLLKGYVFHPLILQCCTWALSWLIVSRLAS